MSIETIEKGKPGRKPIGKRFETKLYPHQRQLLEAMAMMYGLDKSEIVRAALDEKLAKMRRQAQEIIAAEEAA